MMKHILGSQSPSRFLIPAADGVRAQAKKLSVLDYYLHCPMTVLLRNRTGRSVEGV